MPARHPRWMACLLLAGILADGSARAQSYRVAHTSQGFITFDSATINNSGMVVFSALRRDSSGKVWRGVYKGKGGSYITVSEFPAFDPSPPNTIGVSGGVIGFNNKGQVAVLGFYQGNHYLFVGSGSITPAQAIPNISFVGGLLPSITDDGWAAYNGLIISPPIHSLALPRTKPCEFCGGGQGHLNNAHQYLLINRQARTINRVVVSIRASPGGGSFLAPASTNQIATFTTQNPAVVMNDQGAVAYYDEKPDGTVGIYKGSGAPVFEQYSNSEFTFQGARRAAINNNGQVAFLARSRTLGKVAFFNGANPYSDKIVAEMDILLGFQLTRFGLVGLSSKWFNDAGQIMFLAQDLASGGTGIWVTSPVSSPPAPASTPVQWVSPATPPSGSFADANNWRPINGDPPRVPEKNTVLNDTAVFDRATFYTVDIGSQHTERLIVKNGNVVFQNGSYLVDALSFQQPSFVVDNARLHILTAMMLSSTHALIGESAASRVDVGFGGDWVNSGSIRVGGVGEGILTINPGGEVTSAESRIGTGAGGGRVIVDGHTAVWKTGNLAVNAGGTGELIIQNGGVVLTEGQAVVGLNAGTAKVTVQGAVTNNNSSVWGAVGVLEVGGGGTGQLEVKNGGAVLAYEELVIAARPGAKGFVAVQGVYVTTSQTNVSEVQILSDLTVGAAGEGELRIEDGGRVHSFQNPILVIGEKSGSRGKVVVRGVHSQTGIRSQLDMPTSAMVAHIGLNGIASMVIEAGALVKTPMSVISCKVAGRESEVAILGAGSEWIISDGLFVGQAMDAGHSVITLVDGYLKAKYVEVSTNGVIDGRGTLAVDPANRVVNGGTIAPGLSPGTLTILGNYEQQPGGRMVIEIGGTNTADYDHLVITNEAILVGAVTFKFINGFAPKTGDRFDFLDVGGQTSGAFAKVGIQNLAPGFQFNLIANGPLLSMTALNDGVLSSALPGQVQVTLTNVGGLTYAPYALITSNTCHGIALDGPFNRSGNVFSQAFQGTIFTANDCAPDTQVVTGTLLLGALSPGDYSFRIMSNNEVLETIMFTVPPDAGKSLLTPTLLPDGSVQFQIEGLAPIAYTIEASEDLQSWIPLVTGTLPATFTDPDAAILPQRFYRAVISP